MPKNQRKKTQQRAHKNPTHYGSGRSQDNTLVAATIHSLSVLTSSAGGVINTNFPMDPSTAVGTDWADFSSTYDEFRVMGVRITFVSAPVNLTNVNNSMVAVAFDNDSAANPGSYTAVRQYSTSKLFPAVWSTKPLTFTWWRPTRGMETDIPWCDVATPSTSFGCIPLYVDTLSASSSYLWYALDYFVEFRGRR